MRLESAPAAARLRGRAASDGAGARATTSAEGLVHAARIYRKLSKFSDLKIRLKVSVEISTRGRRSI